MDHVRNVEPGTPMLDALYSRSPTRPTRRDWIRVIAIVVGVLAASGVWHWVRPMLIDRLARASLGLPPASRLTWAALQRRYPDLVMSTGWRRCDSADGWGVILRQTPLGVQPPAAWGKTYDNLFDVELRHLATFPTGVIANLDFADHDRDGNIEVQVSCLPTVGFVGGNMSADIHMGVVRLRGGAMELVGAAAWLQPTPASAPSAWAHFHWQDDNADGIKEMALEAVTHVAPPNSGKSTKPHTERLATLVWDKPGGVLRLRDGPADGSLLILDLKGGPIPFTKDDDLGKIIVSRLIPASQPAARNSGSAPK